MPNQQESYFAQCLKLYHNDAHQRSAKMLFSGFTKQLAFLIYVRQKHLLLINISVQLD